MLGRGVTGGAGVALEYEMGIGIGNGKVYQFNILPISGDQDVARLQIPVHYLFQMHKTHCIKYLSGQFVPQYAVFAAIRKHFF